MHNPKGGSFIHFDYIKKKTKLLRIFRYFRFKISDQADGFAVNVSNFDWTANNVIFGTAISNAVGGKHFVIDTSRNGNGPDDHWCNPLGRAVVAEPQGFSSGLVDAYLWAKNPGGSDGRRNGGGPAGQFWPEYACDMAYKAGW